MNGDDILLAALQWHMRGASVLPLKYGTKHPDTVALRSTGHTVDGRPSWAPLQIQPPDIAVLASWFRPDRRLNFGVVTGYGGIICIDFDSFGMFGVWCDWAQAKGGLAAEVAASTYRVLTRRGVHLWLRVAEPVASAKGPGFDIKAGGGYALVPPSIHPSGVRYTTFDDAAPIIECQRLADVFPFVPEAPRRTPAAAAPHPRACQAGNVPSAATVIERIKARLTCADLLGVDLAGREKVQVLCPLHDDHNMSAVVNARGRFFCSAGCTGDHGFDVIDLYGALYRLEFRDVLGKLARELNIDE
ncbi:MAG TPA: hypothetical protein GX714_13015 [Chloroflexi bacterium]|nr:hypothetical protein [Chloroflexota bacterium]